MYHIDVQIQHGPGANGYFGCNSFRFSLCCFGYKRLFTLPYLPSYTLLLWRERRKSTCTCILCVVQKQTPTRGSIHEMSSFLSLSLSFFLVTVCLNAMSVLLYVVGWI